MPTNYPFLYAAGDSAAGPHLLPGHPPPPAPPPTAPALVRVAGAAWAKNNVSFAVGRVPNAGRSTFGSTGPEVSKAGSGVGDVHSANPPSILGLRGGAPR